MNNLALNEASMVTVTPEDTWPAPDLSLLSPGGNTPALPLECFGKWSGWIEETANSCAAPSDYVAISLLVTAAALMGNARAVSPWKGWVEPAILWGALVGSPSSGKSPALNCCLEMMREMEKELLPGFENTLREYETNKEVARATRDDWSLRVKDAVKKGGEAPAMPSAAEEPVIPVRPRLFLSDATAEAAVKVLQAHPKGILNYRDELTGWLEKLDAYTTGNRPFWIEAFGGRSFTVDRAKDAKPIHIERLSISIIGGIQPDRLHRLLLKGDNDGLAARFLFIWPQPIPFKRPREVNSEQFAFPALKRLSELTLTQEEDRQRPWVVPLTSDAAEALDKWAAIVARQTEESWGVFQGFLGKMRGMVARIALVFEYLYWSADDPREEPQKVSYHALQNAIDFADGYLIPMAEKVFGEACLPKNMFHASALAKYLIAHKINRFNARELMRDRVCSLTTKDRMYPALKVLCEYNIIRPRPTREGDTPGRETSDYETNPRLFPETYPCDKSDKCDNRF